MIEFQGVTKYYGKTEALRDVSLTIGQHGIYCLLGRNGAGKTTLLKTLAGHIPATTGTVTVKGRLVSQLAMPDDLHFVETSGSQFNMRLEELIKAAAAINPMFDTASALEMASRFALDTKKRFNQLSFGMKAMINTLIALSSGKEILLLDEPVLGFDPVMRRNFYEMLEEGYRKQPKTVIISTHIIDEIAKVAQHLIIIDKGAPLLNCQMNELDEKAYCVTGLAEHVTAATAGLRVLSTIRAGGFLSQYIYDTRIEPSDKYSISSMSLQDFFIALVGNQKEAI